MRLIAKAAPAAVAAPLFIAAPLLITACSSASSPAASATAASATVESTAQAAPSAPASSTGSFGSLTADQIESRANADLKAAKSFHVSGKLSVSGSSESIDLTSAGNKCSGKITVGGTSERFVQIGATVWVNAGDTSMYLKTSTSSSPNSQAFALCAPGQLASVLTTPGGLTKAGTTLIGGRRVEKLSAAGFGSLDVTISGTPEYVRFTVAVGETLTFSGINTPVSITPPPASQVIGA